MTVAVHILAFCFLPVRVAAGGDFGNNKVRIKSLLAIHLHFEAVHSWNYVFIGRDGFSIYSLFFRTYLVPRFVSFVFPTLPQVCQQSGHCVLYIRSVPSLK